MSEFQARKILAAMWALIAEPKAVTMTMSAVYTLVALIGASLLIERSLRLGPLIGDTGELAMAGCLLVGGALGVLSCPPGWWWLERVALILCGTALGVYSLSTWALHFQGTPGNQVLQAGLAAIVVLFISTRWVRIRYAQINPRR